MELRDIVGLAQDDGQLVAQALIEARLAVTRCDDDRQVGAQAPQVDRECVAAPVGKADIDDGERKRAEPGARKLAALFAVAASTTS